MNLLYQSGAFSSQYPWRTSFCALICSLLLCLGLENMHVETDPEKLWVPPDSVAANEQHRFDTLFGPFFRVEQLIFYIDTTSSASKSLDDLIQKPYLLLLAEMENAIRDTRFPYTINSHVYNLSINDFCYRPIDGKGCLITSPFQYWLGNQTLLQHDPDIKLTTACQTTDPTLSTRAPCMDQIGVPVIRNVVFGGLQNDTCHENPDPCGQSTPKAKALFVTFLLENHPDNQTYTNMVQAWEQHVFLSLASRFASHLKEIQSPMKLTYMAQRSIGDSLEIQTTQNASIVVISYLIMLFYVALSLGKGLDPIHSRFGLGCTGILIVLFSLGVSMGICCALFQMEITMITLEVVPFLILAIGVDNMFILTNEFDRLMVIRGLSPTSSYSRPMFKEDEILSHVMGETMTNVGPSIIVAAISECLAFLVGVFTRIPALTTFCIVASVAVVVNVVLQMTWFSSALILDARRVRARRYDLCPWLRQSIFLSPEKDQQMRYASVRERQKRISMTTWQTQDSILPTSSTAPGRIQSFITKIYIPYLLQRKIKLLVLFTSICMMLLSIVGSHTIPLGLEQELAVPMDFYLHEYFHIQTKYGEAGPLTYLVFETKGLYGSLDYTNRTTQQELNQLLNDLSQLRSYIQLPIYSWLHTFNQWRQLRYFLDDKIQTGDCDCPIQPLDPFPYEVSSSIETIYTSDLLSLKTITPNTLFYPLVRNFTQISIDSNCCQQYGICGAQYKHDIVFENNTSGIIASRMRFQVNALENQMMFINSYYYLQYVIQEWRQHHSIGGMIFPYTLYFIYYEQYSYIQGIALQSILLALLIVFISIYLLMKQNIRLSLILTFCVASMTFSLLGFIFLWNQLSSYGTSINAVSIVNLLACVGLGVEFCIHMTHQFAYSQTHRLGTSGDDHTRYALTSIGPSILSGITLTKFCGIGVLAFAPSMLFRVYFFRMYMGIVLLGFFHGMILLPVLLSLFGQKGYYPNDFSTFLLTEEREE